MKKVKYLLFAVLTMLVGAGFVNAAGNVSVPSTFTIGVGETKSITLEMTDLMALMDIASSDSSIVKVNTPTLDLKTDGPGTVTGTISITGVKEGSANVTITSTDAAEFSSGNEYTFPTKTIAVTVSKETTPAPAPTTPSNPSNPSNPSGGETNPSTTVTNPKTGVEDYLWIMPIALLAGFGAYKFYSKKRLFR